MKIFFCAPYHMPGGPNEVNRNLVGRFPPEIRIKRNPKGVLSVIEALWKTATSDVVIFSGLTFNKMVFEAARRWGKKIVYIMHGCLLIENGRESELENCVLEHSHRILCVSENFSRLMRETFPRHAHKIGALDNGIEWKQFDKILAEPVPRRQHGRIILFGGGRETKHNLEVCQAAQQLNDELDLGLKVDVYGYRRDNDRSPEIAAVPCVEFHHVIPHDEVNRELRKAHIYVQNSTMEPFGLAVIDALALGCDLLVSKYIGSADLIKAIDRNDVIDNPLDVAEVKNKLLFLLSHPNNSRLSESIDRNETSVDVQVRKLIDECMKL